MRECLPQHVEVAITGGYALIGHMYASEVHCLKNQIVAFEEVARELKVSRCV